MENLEQNPDQQNQESINELKKVRIDKFNELKQKGKDPFQTTKYDVNIKTKDILDNFDDYEGKEVKLAGRIMSKRAMGKASFYDIKDRYGRIQTYITNKVIAEDQYEEIMKYDIGDIVGIEGEVFKTQKGEISLRAKEVVLLSKSFLPLPEKFHGLKDTEVKYRQRYLDLIMNDDSFEVFTKRSKILQGIREYLDQRDYLEVETATLELIKSGASARPFNTHLNALDLDVTLRIALELPLKRLIVGGMEKVYEIGRIFRNEGLSSRHNPEFTMVELYEAYADVEGMMDLTEGLFKYLNKKLGNPDTRMFYGHEINLANDFERITMQDAIKKYSNIDFNDYKTEEEAKKLADEHGVEYEKHHKRGDILFFFFEKYAEHHLIQPTFLLEHPVEVSPLAKRCPNNPDFTDRFELFIGGREFANAFSELNDPFDQRSRFEHQESLQEAGDEEAVSIDEDYITALEYGLPPTGGLGIGVDRLTMLLTERDTIRDVILFPTMKPREM